jgi:hypothetical protein
MKLRTASLIVAGLIVADAAPLLAQTSFPPLRRNEFSVLDMRVDHVTDSDIYQGNRKFVASLNTIIEFQYVQPQWETGTEYLPVTWDVGMHARRIEIDVPGGAPIANTLQLVAARIGALAQITRRTSMSFQLDPGMYSDIHDVSAGDFSAPFGMRLMFDPHEHDLTWIFGLHINPRHQFAVIPEIGVRARIFYDWVLHLYLPNPRLTYEFHDDWTFNVGAEWIGGAYNLSKTFGDEFGRPELNDTTLTYRDIRVMAGVKWWFAEDSYLSLNAGWSVKRSYIFDDVKCLTLNGRGAPFIQAALHSEF